MSYNIDQAGPGVIALKECELAYLPHPGPRSPKFTLCSRAHTADMGGEYSVGIILIIYCPCFRSIFPLISAFHDGD